MYCEKCGHEITGSTGYCPYCRTKITGRFQKNQNSLYVPGSGRYPSDEFKKIVYAILAVLIIALLFLSYQVISLNRRLSDSADAEAASAEEETINTSSLAEGANDTEQSEAETEEQMKTDVTPEVKTPETVRTEPVEVDTITAQTSVGDLVYYGAYEQDNRLENGKEPIEWIVLDKKGGSYLLITSEVIDAACYNNVWTETTWGNCSLRDWLNDSFLEEAFTGRQKGDIFYTEHTDEDGFITNDQVFILNEEELERYFPSMDERAAGATSYAEARGVYVYKNGNSWWWVRDAGTDPHYAVYVNCIGDILDYGILVFNNAFGVRPVIRVNK